MKKVIILTLTTLQFLFLSSQTIINSGQVNGTWMEAGSPYLIQGDIEVASDDTLFIEPGVRAIFENAYTFLIYGSLQAIGTESDSIVFTVADTTGFYNGTHTGWGGLVFIESDKGSTVNFSNIEYCSFPNNPYYYTFGGINVFYNNAQLQLNNNTIRNNIIGIDIYESYCEIIISQCLISNNEGGINIQYAEEVIIDQCDISNNIGGVAGIWSQIQINSSVVSYNGSGIYCDNPNFKDFIINSSAISNNMGKGINISWSGSIDLNNSVISDNAGGGIYVGIDTPSGITANNCIIRNNSSFNEGGGIAIFSGHAYLINTIVEGNTSFLDGGGIWCFGQGILDMTNTILRDNSSLGGNGGGLYMNGHIANISGSEITNNSALNGGGIFILHQGYVSNHTFDIIDSKISRNSANKGAGILLDYSYDLSLQRVEFSKNVASDLGGGILFKTASFDNLDANNLTIYQNSAGNEGGGIHTVNNDLTEIKNSIIWNNQPEEISDLNNSINLSYSNINGGYPGTGNIDLDPLFLSSDDNDYHLQWINYPLNDYTKSPCIDTGDPTSPADPDGTPADMGAYPFDHSAYQQYFLDLKVYLQGPFNNGQMETFLNAQDYLPLLQPFSSEPWNHMGLESVTAIPNEDVVDWILLEMNRQNNPNNNNPFEAKSRQAVLLLKDGSIVGLDGASPLEFYSDKSDNLFIKISHRNHLPVMSFYPLDFSNQTLVYDFSQDELMVSGGRYSHTELPGGFWGMTAGDGNSDEQVNNQDKNDIWVLENEIIGYQQGDFNLDTKVDADDLILLWNTNVGKGKDDSTVNDIPEWNCGNQLYDTRDGHSYPTVSISEQCWMAKNLNYGTLVGLQTDQTDNGVVEKYCMNDVQSNCDIYGAIYQWGEVMLYTMDEGTQGICPEGWHVPTDAEWCILENFVDSDTLDCNGQGYRGLDGGGHLKDTSNLWTSPNTGANNLYGFSVLPGGYYNFAEQQIVGEGLYGQFFTSSYTGTGNPWTRAVQNDLSTIRRKQQSGEFGQNLRCVKNP
jgi:uncharacterized protein (TIGR02145 family)